MTSSTSDLVAGAVVAVVFLGIVATAEAWRRWGNPKPEWTRKLIHIAGGLVSLTLPLVIESPLVVLALALGLAALFIAGKLTGRLQSLHGVSRKSSGTEYYPFVIFLLFYFTQGESWKYFICVLVLATADALAALVGSRYGRLRYEVDQNYKSVEGSLVFLVVTWLAVFLPLMLWPMSRTLPPTACVLTALLVALLTTGFEAIAQHGRDNLWVPLGTLVILNQALPLPVEELAERVIVLLAVGAIGGLAAWRTSTFNVGGTLVLILGAYASWMLTSLDWALPIFLAFAFYVLAMVINPRHLVIASKPVVKALALPFFVVVGAYFLQLSSATAEYRALYGPYLAACVTIAAQAQWDQLLSGRPLGRGQKLFGALATTLLTCAAVIVPTYLFQFGVAAAAAIWVTIAALAVGIPAGMLTDHAALARSNRDWWLARSFTIAAAMGLVALLQWAGVSPLWQPR